MFDTRKCLCVHPWAQRWLLTVPRCLVQRPMAVCLNIWFKLISEGCLCLHSWALRHLRLGEGCDTRGCVCLEAGCKGGRAARGWEGMWCVLFFVRVEFLQTNSGCSKDHEGDTIHPGQPLRVPCAPSPIGQPPPSPVPEDLETVPMNSHQDAMGWLRLAGSLKL